MPFRLDDPDRAAEELRRVLCEQYERGSDALTGGYNPHRVRTSCKRARAVIQLIGDPKTDKTLGKMDAKTRKVARAFAGMRDDTVLGLLIESLAIECEVDPGPIVDACNIAPICFEPKPPFEELMALDELRSRAEGLEVPKSAPWKGLRRTYKRARDRMRAAADAEDLHKWRSSVKQHWYHIRLMRRAWPEVMRAWAEELSTLGALLGDHHDLEMLCERLEEARTPDTMLVLAQARRRQEGLERRAMEIGGRAFAPPPSDLVAWRGGLWHTGRG